MAKLEKQKRNSRSQKPLTAQSDAEFRPPVVAVLGHIDHGKSTLIDYIRKTNVTGTEAGGITQHISAYEVEYEGKDGRTRHITLLDTPGHEAFGKLRTRSTNVADIAALVVSAEDGVKPQTLEIIKYIKKCSLPLLVVITKVDKPSADVSRAKQDLAENEVFVEGFGGDTAVVELSAKTGQGVDDFLEMIVLMAEVENNKADRETLGSGIIIETRHDAKRGITAVGIVKDGTVSQGLFAATPKAMTPIRFLLDALGNMVEELSFSSPVQITGWNKMPEIGAEFRTFLKKEEALAFAGSKMPKGETSEKNLSGRKEMEGLETLPLIIKADTAGSLEAITEELHKLGRERIEPKVILSSVGSVSENDIKSVLADSAAIIIGFNTKVESRASLLAERMGVTILLFNIIYELTDKVKELLSEREPKIEVEEEASASKVLKLFGTSKGRQVLGGRVLSGEVRKGAKLKVIRREAEIGQGRIKELQQAKTETETVNEGSEFGAMIESKVEIVPGDVLKTVVKVTK